MSRTSRPPGTPSRKKQHVDIILSRDVSFRGKSTGLGRLEFEHNALPELNLADVDTSARFLGRTLSFPLLVSCMTGGYREALVINRGLATLCEAAGIAMGVGSQRQALEDSRFHRSFSIVREVAPTIPVVGNIGAAEVARMKDAGGAQRLVDLVRADALAVHLNPLQELLQPEGNPEFRGVLTGISRLVSGLSVPIIVKEVGAGLSPDVIRRLLDAGVRHIDVAGAGGTSWAGVEALRSRDRRFAMEFWNWGIPTADAIRGAAALKSVSPSLTIIASGGIGSGLDIARCIALGADLSASARPVLQALARGGVRGASSLINRWAREVRAAMFLTGSRTITELRHARLMTYGSDTGAV